MKTLKEVIITKHGKQRTKDRVGISKKLATKNATKAFEFGVTHAESKGSLRKYFDKLYLIHNRANNVRIYNRNVYIFNGSKLITVLPLPQNLSKLADSIQDKKENEQEKEKKQELEEEHA